ncbi:hypothetical protein SAMN05444412_107150 [Rhodonellum ikkaensis]|uniref:Uncharacterized protein n=1 Tax=Rhodonellum ikkaensis TaxID=336829 RepID=A0A1H3R3Q7_9BACT|nr:hypothetical protein SAMN05444412_107150 [Rhodonellum ikkaensis]
MLKSDTANKDLIFWQIQAGIELVSHKMSKNEQ